MVKDPNQIPKIDEYTINDIDSLKSNNDMDNVWRIWNLIRYATENEICDVFSNWIDKDTKRCSDLLDLHQIKWDIDNYENFAGTNSMPKMSSASQWQAAINIFSNVKEELIWQIVNFIDIPDYIEWICDDIRILQPPKDNNRLTNEQHVRNIWFSFIIPTIRNWIMHNRYILTKNGMYVHSEKSRRKKTSRKDENWNNIVEEKDFEAFIDFKFFLKIIKFSLLSERKQKVKFLDESKINRKKWFNENMENFRFNEFQSKEKWLLHSNIQDKILNRVNEEREGKVQHHNHIQKLSNGQKEFMAEYFKSHEFNRRNLSFINRYINNEGYIAERMSLANNYVHAWIESFLLTQQEYFKTWFNTFKDAIFKSILNRFIEWSNVYNWKVWQDDEKIVQDIENRLTLFWIHKPYSKKNKNEIIELEQRVLNLKYLVLELKDWFYSQADYRKIYLKVLYLSKFYVNNPNLELAQPQKRVWDDLWQQWYNHIKTKCIENPKFYWSNEAKKNHIDQALWRPFRERLFKQLTIWKVDNWIIKNTDNIDQIMDKINLFVTKSKKHLSEDHQEILENNIRNTIKERKEKLDNITIVWEEEHIRNAFAHHNYTIIPWFDKILLWDYSIDDNPNWEKVYSLDELYNNCINKVDDCFLNSKTST